jgi:hypothetical protein
MNNIDLNQFRDWYNEDPGRRSVKIEFCRSKDIKHGIWVYDYELMEGQHVQSVAEIDLEGERRRTMERRLKEAQEFLGRVE